MAITFVATRNKGLKPEDATHSIWDAGNAFQMSMSAGAIVDFATSCTTAPLPAGGGGGGGQKKAAFGSAGMKCAHRGLIGTALQAYNKHHNLSLRPDDVWVTILAQFCAHANANSGSEYIRNSDTFASMFPKENPKRIVVSMGERGMTEAFEDESRFDGNWFVQTMLHNIADEVDLDPELREWLQGGFSTTTARDKMCAAVMAVSTAAESQAEYNHRTMCGIPKVTLEGTLEDWELLRRKISRFDCFSDDPSLLLSGQWLPILRFVCDNLVESARNGSANNLDFWNNMVKQEGGSGGPCLSGWMSTAFSFFHSSGQQHGELAKLDIRAACTKNEWPHMTIASVNQNIVSCPLAFSSGTKLAPLRYRAQLFVAQMSFDIQDDPDSQVGKDANAFGVGLTDEDKASRKRFLPRNDWVFLVQCDPEEQ